MQSQFFCASISSANLDSAEVDKSQKSPNSLQGEHIRKAAYKWKKKKRKRKKGHTRKARKYIFKRSKKDAPYLSLSIRVQD